MAADRVRYNWKRFCYPIGQELHLWNGFLPDPDDGYGLDINPGIVAADSLLDDAPCVVILGEQGIGKSSVLEEAAERADSGGAVLRIDTGRLDSGAMLARLLDANPVFQNWLAGDRMLCLFLDSLDEGPLDAHGKAALLEAQLPSYPLDRLRLRIACRTADWPTSLETALGRMWKDSANVYALAPLRQADVELAACANGIDPEAFIGEIGQKYIGALASKPLSLQMLLKHYGKHGSLPLSQMELMKEGLLRLCEEITDARRAHARINSEQRMMIAGRIAAISMFCKRSAIWTGADHLQCPDNGCATIEEIGEHSATDGGDERGLDERAVRDTLNSGLFRPQGNGCVGWGHQTYAEFLAAWYVTQHDATVSQMKRILLHPTGLLVPQLRGVAAWLAEMNHGVFGILAESDPEALLLTDLTIASDAERSALAQVLLDLYERPGASLRDRYPCGGLQHPGLSDQIRPYLRDCSRAGIVRAFALVIAEDCRLDCLSDDLLAIALNPAEHWYLRLRAADAITESCSSQVRAKLVPLAAGEVGEDPDDEVKGVALRAVWPDCVSVDELLALLTTPSNSSMIGAYWAFCHYDVLKSLKPADLPAALDWTRLQPASYDARWFEKLIIGLIELAWEHLDAPGVTVHLASALVLM